MSAFPVIEHQVDLCVVGGGLAGLCTASAAARHGAKVALMQERPMLGGNASSEIRMWVCGAHGANMRETGLMEEILLENYYRNPDKNYSVWDGVLYEKIAFDARIDLLLNCTCNQAEMEDGRIRAVTGWQMTTQTFHRVSARLFADCSGDSVLAPLTGAGFRQGREAQSEFDEDIAPLAADRRTMGLSCMLMAREETRPSTFIAPAWAEPITREKLTHRMPDLTNPCENFWYLELGGDRDAIGDTETVRDELLALAYGIWDYLKNAPENKEKNRCWRLDWVGILPGKRESRRYIGDYTLTQNDVREGGHFEDLIAYGGWSMDDHNPAGFRTAEEPTIFHPAPSPYGIPYRCLYSRDVENLLFAGRNISATHTAMSSSRVMATCALLGQAAGTAAAIAIRHQVLPRDVYRLHLPELQQTLMEDDCYLPYHERARSALTLRARLENPAMEALRNGVDRPVGKEDNGYAVKPGESIVYRFDSPEKIARVRIVFDSDLNRLTLPPEEARLNRPMIHNRPLAWPDAYVPKTLVKAYRIDALTDGEWKPLIEVRDNHQRLRIHPVQVETQALRLTPLSTWGAENCHLFALDAEEEPLS